MYRKIMVPLDGSTLAECVLPHVKGFIRDCRVASIVLVRVVEPAPTRFSETTPMSSERLDKLIKANQKIEKIRKNAAADYLNRVAEGLKSEGVKIAIEVLVGNVADSLADFTESQGVDLILIATHGRSGVSRWLRGSIADRVLRFAQVPVLMVRAPGTMGEGKK